jgi:hypothetical protein
VESEFYVAKVYGEKVFLDLFPEEEKGAGGRSYPMLDWFK